KDKIRFIDTGYKTFPLMFAALIRMWYPEKQVLGLVQKSGIKLSILPQLNPLQWREHVQEYILSTAAAQYADANFGYSEDANGFLKHPIGAKTSGVDPKDPFDVTLAATSAATQFESFWDQLSFVLGSIKYNDLLKGITQDIIEQGVDSQTAESLVHGAIQDGLGIVNVVDSTGVQISAMPTVYKEIGAQGGLVKAGTGQEVAAEAQLEPAQGPEKEVELAATPQDIVAQIEKDLQEKLKDKVPDFKLSDTVKKQFEDVVASKNQAVDVPVIAQHNAEVIDKSNPDDSRPSGGAPGSNNNVVTLFDADPYVAGLTDYNAKEWYNQEIKQRKWYNPVKWWLGMTETAKVTLRGMDRTAQLRALINEGRASGIVGELGLNTADELISSETGILADIASRDFELSNERVSQVTDGVIVAKIKTLFLDFIKGTIGEAEFENRVRTDIAPDIRQAKGAATIGSNLLRKAKALSQEYLNNHVNVQELKDLNITINFALLKHAFVQTREVNGWWNRTIVNTMNRLQSLPIMQFPVLGALTSPGFVGVTMSLAGQAVTAGSRFGAKTLAVGGLTGILLPVLGTSALIAMGVAVALAGVVSAFRANTRMWKNLSLLEVREALGSQSQKMTAVEAKMLSNGAVVDKLRVSTAMEDLRRLTGEYNATPGVPKRQALEKSIAEILARLDYGYEASAEFFLYDTDRFIEQESQRKDLLDTVRQAATALGADRNAIAASSHYIDAKNVLDSNYTQSLKNFGR
ncbi:MAG: hypothetical protein HY591_01075, partial [Candidatus Omnitrophica bacterium]|nr:hypothetical protein [Candidatus Omnitrophota bacterium]